MARQGFATSRYARTAAGGPFANGRACVRRMRIDAARNWATLPRPPTSPSDTIGPIRGAPTVGAQQQRPIHGRTSEESVDAFAPISPDVPPASACDMCIACIPGIAGIAGIAGIVGVPWDGHDCSRLDAESVALTHRPRRAMRPRCHRGRRTVKQFNTTGNRLPGGSA